MVYRKILTMEQTQKTDSGQVVNLVASDAQLFADSINTFNTGVTAPIQILRKCIFV